MCAIHSNFFSISSVFVVVGSNEIFSFTGHVQDTNITVTFNDLKKDFSRKMFAIARKDLYRDVRFPIVPIVVRALRKLIPLFFFVDISFAEYHAMGRTND